MQHDYYEILEVPRDAAQLEIKKSYYKLAKKYHPDNVNKKNCLSFEKKMVLINEAYAVLSNVEKRNIYDKNLKNKKNFKWFFWK